MGLCVGRDLENEPKNKSKSTPKHNEEDQIIGKHQFILFHR